MTESFEDATLLLHIGAPRTGSKWITQYCYDHPDILMSPIKNLHFFDDQSGQYFDGFVERLDPMEERLAGREMNNPPPMLGLLRDRVRMREEPSAYLEYFRRRWAGEAIFCDVTPSYHWQERSVYEQMARAHRKVKFLFVLRNPIDRLWSGMRLQKARDPATDLDKLFEQRLANQRPPKWARYGHALQMLDSVAAPENTHITFFDYLFTDEAMSALCEFLEIDPATDALGPPVNQGAVSGLEASKRERLFEPLASEYQAVHKYFCGALPPSWLHDMERFG